MSEPLTAAERASIQAAIAEGPTLWHHFRDDVIPRLLVTLAAAEQARDDLRDSTHEMLGELLEAHQITPEPCPGGPCVANAFIAIGHALTAAEQERDERRDVAVSWRNQYEGVKAECERLGHLLVVVERERNTALAALVEHRIAYTAITAERDAAEQARDDAILRLEIAEGLLRSDAVNQHLQTENAQLRRVNLDLVHRLDRAGMRAARLEDALAADEQRATRLETALRKLVDTTNVVIDTIGPQLERIHEPGVERLAATASQALALLDADETLRALAAPPAAEGEL